MSTVVEIVDVGCTDLATVGNAGAYTMVASDTNDQRLAEMWINKPRRSKTGGRIDE